MELAAWMQQTETSAEALAARIGVHLVTVYHWKAKRKFPRTGHLRAIEAITGGAVTASDLVPRPEAGA